MVAFSDGEKTLGLVSVDCVLLLLVGVAAQVMDFLGSAAFSQAVQALDVATGALVCLKIIKNNKVGVAGSHHRHCMYVRMLPWACLKQQVVHAAMHVLLGRYAGCNASACTCKCMPPTEVTTS
jgi:hypothetical protein